jgi:hypothetical protein
VGGAHEAAGRFRDEAEDAFRVERLGQPKAGLAQPLQVAAAALQAVMLVPDAADHHVEALGQILDLVPAAHVEGRVQVAVGGAHGARDELGEGARDPARQHEGSQDAERDRGRADAGQVQAHVADLGLHLFGGEDEPHRAEPLLAALREHGDRHVQARLEPRHPVPA